MDEEQTSEVRVLSSIWFATWMGVLVLGILLVIFSMVQTIHAVPVLSRMSGEPTEPTEWPGISMIIPACNEADTLRSALQTILAEDYPTLQIILVNDRSTDQTGAMMEEIATQDNRIKVVHVAELPDGWLGKVHALHQGVGHATQEWLLFTDADVHYRPGTLRKAMLYAQQKQRDFLTMFPQLVPGGPLLNVAYSTFVTAILLTIKAWEIPDPKSPAFTGIGHFMLIREAAFRKTPGFSWLKMDVVDDGALGRMMKLSGASCEFLNGREQLSLRWYRSLGDMSKHLEKNMFGATAYYSAVVLGIGTLLTTAGLISPWLALFSASPTIKMAGAFFLVNLVVTGILVNRWFGFPWFFGCFLWVGAWLMMGMQWRSATQCWKQGGIVWRGTHYPISALREGLRIVPGKPRAWPPDSSPQP